MLQSEITLCSKIIIPSTVNNFCAAFFYYFYGFIAAARINNQNICSTFLCI